MSVGQKSRGGQSALVWGSVGVAATVSLALVVTAVAMPGHLYFAAAGGVGLVVTAIGAGLMLGGGSRRGVSSEPLGRQMEELARAMEQLAEQGSLSDDARRVLNRRRDRELLRRAIEEDINAEDWDAAMVLVKELAERFGYRMDAEEFRGRIEQARFDTVQRKVSQELAQLDSLIRALRWEEALREAARIVRLYPDSPRVEGLRHQVEHARRLYKTDLERRFLNAAEVSKVDEAMALLKELDSYLTEAEAEPYREVARTVIAKARDQMGAQFRQAVQERQWGKAQQYGEQIMAQFPNSRMAQEVGGMLEDIKGRVREAVA
jgi:tetratricopeptide (TPR) repeat protein